MHPVQALSTVRMCHPSGLILGPVMHTWSRADSWSRGKAGVQTLEQWTIDVLCYGSVVAGLSSHSRMCVEDETTIALGHTVFDHHGRNNKQLTALCTPNRRGGRPVLVIRVRGYAKRTRQKLIKTRVPSSRHQTYPIDLDIIHTVVIERLSASATSTNDAGCTQMLSRGNRVLQSLPLLHGS